MLRVATSLQASQPARFWPFPGLYLIEVVTLAFVIFVAVLTERALTAAWVAIGALSALTLLGAMTIGPFVGAALLFLVPAIFLSTAETDKRPWRHLSGFGLGLGLQTGAMVLVIQAMLR